MRSGAHWRTTARLLGSACRRWSDDGASRQGAAIAFYTTLSLAPFLLVLATVAAFFLGADAARGYIVDQSGAVVGTQGGALLKEMLGGGSGHAKGWAALIGIVSTIAGATAGFAELQESLNQVFRVPARHGLRATVTARLSSLLLVIGVGVLLVASLALTALVSRSLDWFDGTPRLTKWVALGAIEIITLGVATVLFGLVLKVLPVRRVPWRFAVRGGLVAAALFQLAKFAIGWYIGRATGAAAYGAAAALVVLMLWIYFSAQVFLLGAEFAAASLEAHEAGSLDGPRPG